MPASHGEPPASVDLVDIAVTFPRRAGAVLSGVTLRIERGEQVVVFGPSGAGKSTLLSVITGMIPHAVSATLGGTARIAGLDTRAVEVAELSRHVGLVAQDPDASICLPSVDQELALPLENRGVEPALIAARIDAALRAVGALELRERASDELSGGETQRIALAAAVIGEPDVLLLDEPTSMLDAAGIRSVQRAIGTAVERYGPAVVLVEHRLDEFSGDRGVAGLPERSIVLGEGGTILHDGPTATVLVEAGPALHAAGCWLPLEVELQAVFGSAGGLKSSTVRAGLREWAAEDADQPEQEGGPHDPRPLVLAANDLGISRDPSVARHRSARWTRFARRRVPAPPALLIARASIQLRAGEIVAVLGANGSGKTSLLLTLAGLLPPATGAIVGDRPGMVFQNPEHQFVASSVRGELAHNLQRTQLPLIDRLLAAHRLQHVAEQNPHRLSGGEKRRLSVAAMLAHRRVCLIADEPTFGLDRTNTIALIAAFQTISEEGRGILFSSHDLRTAATLAHRAIVISDGSLVMDGPIFDLLGRPDLVAAAGLSVPPLLSWLHENVDTAEQMRQVLRRLDAAVAGASVASAGEPATSLGAWP
ncbi:hypothetical protein GCM10022381_04120 [Leifsonia kafniensis]|uniref:ABC transporter domain-containing protein n=1 Tax=Leifsonia kafniensis TaxID=475957 RepID=A0ABP7K2A9_9MICO